MSRATVGSELSSGRMLPWSASSVARETLQIGEPFDRGGEGLLFRLSTPQHAGPALLYKEYHPDRRELLRVDPLLQMSRFARDVDVSTREWLYERSAWPTWIVEEGPRPTGVIIPLAPHRYMTDVRTSAGGRRSVPAKMELLLNGEDFLRSVGLSVSPRQRLELLLSAAETLAFFHAHRMFVGDFSCKNILFSLGSPAEAFFIDCDSISWNGESALPTGETPEWELPNGEALGQASSDLYKFALLALRVHSGAQHHRSLSRLPADVAGPVRSLIDRSLSAEGTARPLITEWIGPLLEAIASADDASPVMTSRVPVRTVLRPAPVRPPGRPAGGSFPGSSGPGGPALLPPGRVNDAVLSAARYVLIRRPAAPSVLKLVAMILGLWAGCAVVLGITVMTGVDLARMTRNTEVAIFGCFLAMAVLAFYLAITEPA